MRKAVLTGWLRIISECRAASFRKTWRDQPGIRICDVARKPPLETTNGLANCQPRERLDGNIWWPLAIQEVIDLIFRTKILM